MKCSKCGAELSEDTKFCSYCGQKIEVTPPPVVEETEIPPIPDIENGKEQKQEKTKATASKSFADKVKDKGIEIWNKLSLYGKVTTVSIAVFVLLCLIALLAGKTAAVVIAIVQIVMAVVSIFMHKGVIKLEQDKLWLKWLVLAVAVLFTALNIMSYSWGSKTTTTGQNPSSSNQNTGETAEQIDWKNITLSKVLPEPQSNMMELLYNGDDWLNVTVCDISENDFLEYVRWCKDDYGFTVDSDSFDDYFYAYNKDGYCVTLFYTKTSKKLSIDLSAPIGDGAIDPDDSTTDADDNNQETIDYTLDYADAASFEKALNDGKKVNGKIVQFEVIEYKPDSILGVNCWAGEHLNFISEDKLDVESGNIIVGKITKEPSKTLTGSWKIYYDVLSITKGESVTQTQKNGFDSSTNEIYPLASYTVEIPKYWKSENKIDSGFQRYAETNGKVAMLQVSAQVETDDSYPVTFDGLMDDNDNMIAVIEATAFEKVTDYEVVDTGIVKGILYKGTIIDKDSGLTGYAEWFEFASEEDRTWCTLIFCQTDNTEYSYTDDFMKIIKSIKPVENMPSETTPPTTTEITLTMGKDDFKGMNYQEAEKKFREMGFVNFEYKTVDTKTESSADTICYIEITELFFGKSNFSKGDKFDADSTITFYTYKYTAPSPVSYSTNDLETAKKGNTGVFSYKSRGGSYDIYWIIDFDEGYVYWFTDGNGDTSCDRIAIVSGTLNDAVTITYHDGNSTWSYRLFFKWQNQPDHLVMQDNNGFTYDYYSTNLSSALSKKNSRTIYDY